MSETITFTLNGAPCTVQAEPHMKLLDVLRDELNLTGTKRGCDNSTCGACVVVVNGKAVKSCNYNLAKLEGAEVLTIEGLASGTDLHPIQEALIEAGSVQCGFCTPGIILELYALLNENPDASKDEIMRALNKHLCRCTGYEAIVDGALLAQEKLQGQRV
jgi:aerobic carbon-monoxide dehydrogenase small subunit